MRLLVFELIFAIWAFKGLFDFRLAAGLYIFVEIFKPLMFAYAPGAFPASIMAIAAMMIAYFYGLASGRIKFRPNFLLYASIPFLMWVIYCTKASPFPAAAVVGLKTGLIYIIPVLLLSTGINSRKDLNYILLITAISIGIWSSRFGLNSLFSGVNRYMEIPGSQMGDNNYLAAGIDASIPLLFLLAFHFGGKFAGFWRKVFLFMLFFSILAVIFSDSRGGALGLVAMVIVYLFVLSRKKLRDLSLAALLAIVIAAVLPQSFYDRMSTLNKVGTTEAEDSAKERLQLVKSAFAAAKDHMVKGVGPYCWIEISKDYTGLDRALETHNIWLKVWVEFGIPGLVLFVIAWFGVIIELIMTYRSAHVAGNQWVARVTMCIALSLFSFVVTYTFLNYWDSEYLWLLLGLGSAVCSLYRRGELEPEEDDEKDTVAEVPAPA